MTFKFEVEGGPWRKKSWKQKQRAPPNYVGQIRSYLNLEVVLEVKKTKNTKSLKISQLFLAFFAKSTGHNDTKICTVHHMNIPYKCSFIKMSLSKKSNWKLSQQQQQLWQFHGLGFAADKKLRPIFAVHNLRRKGKMTKNELIFLYDIND